ncbi:MAG: leucine-rich repeat domain-containing protein [Kiritimatiellia bacterium]
MRFFSVFSLSLSLVLLLTGCFDRQTVRQEVVATSFDTPAKQDVTFLNLCLPDGQKGIASPIFPESLADFPSLQRISLRNQAGLTSLPPAVTTATALIELDLSYTGVIPLPESLSALSNLRNLYLSGIGYKTLPHNLPVLPALRYLNLDRNALETLPDSIGQFSALRWVRLNENKLTGLPASAANWKDIRRLYLRGNQLTQFPKVILEMSSLEQLDLGDNDIESLPEELCTKLPNLNRIDLDGNKRLAKLPEAFGKMPALTHAFLSGTAVAADTNEIARLRRDAPNPVRFFIAF